MSERHFKAAFERAREVQARAYAALEAAIANGDRRGREDAEARVAAAAEDFKAFRTVRDRMERWP